MAIRGVFDVVDGAFGLATTETGGGAAASGGEWVRNKAWPELTEPTAGEQKVVGLYAVFPGDSAGLGNFFSVTCAGAYTVDYGDGSAAVNVATGVQLDYEYDFDDGDLYDATVTLTDAGDLVTRTDHGYSDGDRVQLYRIASTTGVSEGQSYYVISSTANTFQLSLTEGGSAVTLTTNGTAALLPYKIATVTITPQAGQNLTSINIISKPAAIPTNSPNAWLEVVVRAASCTTLTNYTLNLCSPKLLERYAILAHANTSFASKFQGLSSLKRVEINSTAGVTSFSSCFNGCGLLHEAPWMDTSSATTVANMFTGCYGLELVPFYNLAGVGSVNAMFSSCQALKVLPAFALGSATDARSFAPNSAALNEFPAISFNSVTTGNFSSLVPSSGALKRFSATGMNFSFSLQNNQLTATALNEVYTNLPTVVGQTITVTANPGVSGDDPTIATAKGWAVTG